MHDSEIPTSWVPDSVTLNLQFKSNFRLPPPPPTGRTIVNAKMAADLCARPLLSATDVNEIKTRQNKHASLLRIQCWFHRDAVMGVVLCETNADLMLAHRLQQGPSIKSAFVNVLRFLGIYVVDSCSDKTSRYAELFSFKDWHFA